MNESAITVRYAKALYQVGDETGKLETIRDSIDFLHVTVKESAEFVEMLQSPIIKSSEKNRIFSEIFEGKLDKVVITFFNLLTQNKREQYLSYICLNFLQLYKKEKGIKEAVLTTAHTIDKKHREEIVALLKKKFKLNIELTEQVNENIVGGFKLRIDDQQVDASISSKLRKIQNELINS